MTMSRQIERGLVRFALALLVAGCARDALDGDASPAVTANAKSASAGRVSGHAVATSPGKPLPPIGFGYTIVGAPVIGQPLEITLSASVADALAELNIALSGSERLFVAPESMRLRMAGSARQALRTQTIHVTPMAAGSHRLSVLLEAVIDGRLQSRAVTIPIGDALAAPQGPPGATLGIDAGGELIISLPAQGD